LFHTIPKPGHHHKVITFSLFCSCFGRFSIEKDGLSQVTILSFPQAQDKP